MPANDKTGPRGQGPLTGRGFGPCGANETDRPIRSAGRGGYARGGGRGRAFGGGRQRGRGWGRDNSFEPETAAASGRNMDQEIAGLKEQNRQMQEQLAQMNERLANLTQTGPGATE